ncbi:hypothetical protein ACJX0J_006809, partial [Zea mays]
MLGTCLRRGFLIGHAVIAGRTLPYMIVPRPPSAFFIIPTRTIADMALLLIIIQYQICNNIQNEELL